MQNSQPTYQPVSNELLSQTTSSSRAVQSPVASSSALKRKLEVFVDIPPSPLHRTSPAGSPLTPGGSLARRLSKPVVQIPLSPTLRARMNIGSHRNGMKGSPLSAKAFNLNTSASTEPPLKKSKLAMSSTNDSNMLRCHQCADKCDLNGTDHHLNVLFSRLPNLFPDLAFCKSMRTNGQPCKVRFCSKCVRRRYNESFETIKGSQSQTWV